MRLHRLLPVTISLLALTCVHDQRQLTAPELTGLQGQLVAASEAVNLTQHSAAQDWPAVSGNVVVWSDSRTGDAEIFGCDISQGLAACPANPVNLTRTTPSFGEVVPSISGSTIVWARGPFIGGGQGSTGGSLFACDISGGLDQCAAGAVPLQVQGVYPVVQGNRIVWRGIGVGIPVGELFRVFGCDISGGLTTCAATKVQLGQDVAINVGGAPAFSGDLVVWIGPNAIGINGDVFACNISAGLEACRSTTVNLTNGSFVPGAYVTAGGNIVIWADVAEAQGRVFACDISGGLETCPATTMSLGTGLFWPLTDGNRIVWRTGGPTPTIMGCDVSADLGTCFTNAVTLATPGSGRNFALSDNVLVWVDGRTGDLEIFGLDVGDGGNHAPTAVACAAVNVPPLPPPCLETVTSASGPIPRPITLDGSGSRDPDGDVLTFRWTEGETLLGEGETIEVLLGTGQHAITLTVSDGRLEATDEVVVSILALPAIAVSPEDLLEPGAPLDFSEPGDSSFEVTNVGGNTLTVVSRLILPFDSPFSVLLGTALELGPGETGRVTVSFNPKEPQLYKAQLFLDTNDPNVPTVAIQLAGEDFRQCSRLARAFQFGTSPCDLLDNLRFSLLFDIDRYDADARIYASDTELFSYVGRHADEIRVLANMPEYAKKIEAFVRGDPCKGDSKVLDLIDDARELADVVRTLKDISDLVSDPEGFLRSVTINGLAGDLVLMQVKVGLLLADGALCIGSIRKQQWIRMYVEFRDGADDAETAFGRAFDDPPGLLLLVLADFGIKSQKPEAVAEGRAALVSYFEAVWQAFQFAKLSDSEKRRELKAYGRRIAICAVDEFRDVRTGVPVNCDPPESWGQ